MCSTRYFSPSANLFWNRRNGEWSLAGNGFMLARCAGRISFDSMIENNRHRTTTEPMAAGNAPNPPGTVSKGIKVTTVVNTPKVAGMATRLAPRITLSSVWPSRSLAVCTLSPMMMASSTTIPSTRMNPKRLSKLREPSTKGKRANAPRNAIGIPSITQKANCNLRNMPSITSTNTIPIVMLETMMLIDSER